ncbi:hypothetical protein NON00_02440 [Roseomonas sp. GC11]|uniref:hypothetical protein n=1 Tax=Roseomonas sp. GC11 TaxID=2950546 RepID=UPI002109986C|nr:hypothetical protein [Roseomonas sp. GC11]MCQ4158786.1 hypothetical protein [Roseomonas sp. GC11]
MIQRTSRPGVIRLDRDKLNMVSTEATARAAMEVVDALQKYRPEIVVAGIAAAFKLLARAHGIDEADAARVAGAAMTEADGRYIPEFRAVADYLSKET